MNQSSIMTRSSEFENSKTGRVQRANWHPLGMLKGRETEAETEALEVISRVAGIFLFLGADSQHSHPSLHHPSACLEPEVQVGQELESVVSLFTGQQLWVVQLELELKGDIEDRGEG